MTSPLIKSVFKSSILLGMVWRLPLCGEVNLRSGTFVIRYASFWSVGGGLLCRFV